MSSKLWIFFLVSTRNLSSLNDSLKIYPDVFQPTIHIQANPNPYNIPCFQLSSWDSPNNQNSFFFSFVHSIKIPTTFGRHLFTTTRASCGSSSAFSMNVFTPPFPSSLSDHPTLLLLYTSKNHTRPFLFPHQKGIDPCRFYVAVFFWQVHYSQ